MGRPNYTSDAINNPPVVDAKDVTKEEQEKERNEE